MAADDRFMLGGELSFMTEHLAFALEFSCSPGVEVWNRKTGVFLITTSRGRGWDDPFLVFVGPDAMEKLPPALSEAYDKICRGLSVDKNMSTANLVRVMELLEAPPHAVALAKTLFDEKWA